MAVSDSEAAPTYGYLLVVEDERHGFTGGLLVVCDRGRPLEFHCTEPVRPSRAQQILFGPTLRSYLLGEQLGGALLSKATLPITLLLVEDAETAEAGRRATLPTRVVNEESAAAADEAIERMAERLAASIDLAEPFERVREAIGEAQRLVVGDDGADDRLEGGSRAAA